VLTGNWSARSSARSRQRPSSMTPVTFLAASAVARRPPSIAEIDTGNVVESPRGQISGAAGANDGPGRVNATHARSPAGGR